GPSYNPIAPRKDGYNVDIIDVESKEELLKRYEHLGIDLSVVEDVTFIWKGEKYRELVGNDKYYDWIIASHVIEHTPDLIEFINDCSEILKQDGVLALVVPDKRFCFDFYRPLTSLSAVINAHVHKESAVSLGAVAEHHLYAVMRNGVIAWEGYAGRTLNFAHSLDDARRVLGEKKADIYSPNLAYVHSWCFVPHSFRILIRDLFDLGFIDMDEIAFYPTVGHEFYIVLGKNRRATDRPSRMEMLYAIEDEMMEVMSKPQIEQTEQTQQQSLGFLRGLLARLRGRLWRIAAKALKLVRSSVAFLVVAFCFLPSARSEEINKIGVIFPFSGEVSRLAYGAKEGIEIAAKELKGVKFIFEDEGFCDAKKALTAALKLIQIDKVKILITGCLNGTLAILPAAKRNNILILSAGDVPKKLVVDNQGYVLPLASHIEGEVIAMVRYIEKLSYKKIYIFRHDDNFTAEFSEKLHKYLKGTPVKVLGEEVVSSEGFSWLPVLTKSLSKKPDLIVAHLGEQELTNFLKAKNILKDKTPIFSGRVIVSYKGLLKGFPKLVRGIYFTDVALAEENDKRRIKFEATYKRLFKGHKPRTITYYVYDGIALIFKRALLNCKVIE
ncbi:MAG: methyltransferase domain-containing protein, partial [Candidatus Dadabacteria bacterium]